MTALRNIITALDIRYQTGILLLIFLGLLVAYFYFLSSSVVNVVVSREYAQAQSEAVSSITELEAEYIQMQHTVRKEIALQNGFVAVADKAFVTRFETTLAAGGEER